MWVRKSACAWRLILCYYLICRNDSFLWRNSIAAALPYLHIYFSFHLTTSWEQLRLQYAILGPWVELISNTIETFLLSLMCLFHIILLFLFLNRISKKLSQVKVPPCLQRNYTLKKIENNIYFLFLSPFISPFYCPSPVLPHHFLS